MEYNLQIKDKTITVEMTLKQDCWLSATIKNSPDDRTDYEQIQYGRISDHQVRLMVNGQQINAWIIDQTDGKTIIIGGERFFIQDKDKLAQTQTLNPRTDKGPDQVTPPMPAVVINVPVQLGDIVEKGDTVVVVSAMKMETSLVAPHGGTITRIGINEGDKVMPGDILIDIEKNEVDKIEIN
ncbi:MAG: hypothetical protein GY710_14510 [Desulfobacteraceae bacterium]|nr:hypothetical protein [Desulfobacteraceae bacterium]